MSRNGDRERDTDMRDDEVVALIAVLVISAVVLTVYVGLIVLGVNMAKRKNRSPHWFWFAVHPSRLTDHTHRDGLPSAVATLSELSASFSRPRAPLRVLRIRFCDSRLLRAPPAARLHAAPLLVLLITKKVRQAFGLSDSESIFQMRVTRAASPSHMPGYLAG